LTQNRHEFDAARVTTSLIPKETRHISFNCMALHQQFKTKNKIKKPKIDGNENFVEAMVELATRSVARIDIFSLSLV
jgi:hypothetical protein